MWCFRTRLLLCLLLWSGPVAAHQTVTVFAAASLTEVVAALRPIAAEDGLTLRVNLAGSATLARQIAAGAPADLFLSANPAWVAHLDQAGLIVPDARRVFAGNRLVVIAAGKAPPAASVAAALARLQPSQRLAMGDPRHVPAGQYAKAALVSLGLWPAVQDRLAPAPDVRRAVMLVTQGAAPLGIVYATDARAFDQSVTVVADIPPDSHPPIMYEAAVVRTGDADAGAALLASLLSETMENHLKSLGFLPSPSPF